MFFFNNVKKINCSTLTLQINCATEKHGYIASLDISPLTDEEIQNAEMELIKHVQQACFPFLSFKINGEELSPRLPRFMQKLRPFYLDGVLQAGGRLKNANVDVDVKHSIILPQSSYFTELVIRQYHTAVGHSEASHT